jgi:predicted hotdog family 3-hydroxylacyl-ACP dehydratase
VKVGKADIESFIPQRAPFIMVDNLLEATQSRFETDFTILPDNIFIEDDVLREFALIENIAQSAAAGIGYLNKASSSMPPDGFIGAISKLIVHDLPGSYDTVYTVVTKLLQLENMYLLRGENFVNGRKILECEVKLVGKTSTVVRHTS